MVVDPVVVVAPVVRGKVWAVVPVVVAAALVVAARESTSLERVEARRPYRRAIVSSPTVPAPIGRYRLQCCAGGSLTVSWLSLCLGVSFVTSSFCPSVTLSLCLAVSHVLNLPPYPSLAHAIPRLPHPPPPHTPTLGQQALQLVKDMEMGAPHLGGNADQGNSSATLEDNPGQLLKKKKHHKLKTQQQQHQQQQQQHQKKREGRESTTDASSSDG